MAVKERNANSHPHGHQPGHEKQYRQHHPKHRPMWMQTLMRVFEGPAAKVGLVMLIIILVLCLGAPLFTQYTVNDMDLLNMNALPSKEHLLGCDSMGRDLWTRLLYGGRTSIALGILGSLFAAVGGTLVGLVAGYFGGQVDNLIMRFCDVWSAIPGMLLCMLVASVLGNGFFQTIVALGVGAIPNGARMTRGQILSERTKEYLEAAESINVSKSGIMIHHLLPNVLSPTLVGTTMGVGGTIMQAASLSYIGLGVDPLQPEWGAMLSSAKTIFNTYPHEMLYPGLAIGLFVFSINLMGDGLRDAMDPKLRK
jgi:ABC-type dipeptide/oligopeptide/nickel transport system permease subunit